MLHNLRFMCPIFATYKINYYATPSRLFIVVVAEIRSSTAMGANALGILPLREFWLQFINLNEMNVKEAVFADDFSVASSLNSFKDYWGELTAIGLKYSYFPKPVKSYLMVKEKKIDGCAKLIC